MFLCRPIFTGVDPTKPDEIEDIRRLADKVAAKSLELGGTCTGEHGVGLGKTDSLCVLKCTLKRLNPAHNQ